jgi:hypothetical protein
MLIQPAVARLRILLTHVRALNGLILFIVCSNLGFGGKSIELKDEV